MNIDVKIKKVRECTALPEYATGGSAALDIRAAIEAPIIISAGGRCAIPAGFALALPQNTVALICPRSGLSLKHGIILSNSIGVIDSDYRGEVMVSLRNIGEIDYTVNPGDRIAQMMIIPVYTASLVECDELDDTERGEGGFGSTGRN